MNHKLNQRHPKHLSDWMPASLKLARRLSCIEHRANPMANIMNMTTKSQDLYPDLLGKKSAIWRFVNSFTGALVSVHKSCRYWHKKTQLEDLQTNTDVLIISHLTDQDHLKNDEDFYFGGLAKSIEAAGYNQYTILINHARCDVRNQAKPPNTSVLPAFLSPIEEIRIVSRMIYAAFSLPNIGKGPNEKRFHFLARIAQFNSRAIGDFRIGTLINQFIQRSKPRAVIHTYEGHGWERILSASAHSLPPPPLILGYQHAVLFPGKKSISHDYGVAMPDHVFTQGDITRTAIINEGSLPENYFTTLGSIKSKSRNKNITFERKGACLIAPEGTLSEVIIMAKLSVKAAKIMPDQKFVLRLHPVLNPARVKKSLDFLMPFPHNFSLSQKTINEDFKASSWLCYRGSTMAFQGILNGLRPIYLNPDQSAIDNDPITDKLVFRRVVNDEKALTNIIANDKAYPVKSRSEFGAALTYAKKYLMPFNPEVMIKYLKDHLDS